MPRHFVGGLGEGAERTREGTRGKGGEARDEGGHERSRDETGGEAQLRVVTEAVRPVPYVVADRLLDGVQIVDEYGHRVPPGAGLDAQRGAVGGAFRLVLVGGGASGALGAEGFLQRRALGRGGDLPEAGEGGDACGAHLGEGEVLTAVEGALGEHTVEETAFESDRLLGHGQFPQRGQSVAQFTVGAGGGVRHGVYGVEGVDGGGVEGESGGTVDFVRAGFVRAGGPAVGGSPVGGGAGGGEAPQVPLDDILDGSFGAHSAQRGVNALARSGERCAEPRFAAQQAVRQAAFPLQLVHQRLDPQAEADLGTGRPRVAEGLGTAVHGQTGHRQQQTDRDRDDHRHTASDAAPARHRTATGSRSATAAAPWTTPAETALADRVDRRAESAGQRPKWRPHPHSHEASPTAAAAGFLPVRPRGTFGCATLTPQAGRV